jgi:hypothetical protein
MNEVKNGLSESTPGAAIVEVLPRPASGLSVVRNLEHAVQVGEIIFRSNAVDGIRNAHQAVVKIIAGMELGFGPLASVMNVHFIEGKPSIGAHLRAALVKASDKYDYEIIQNDPTVCELAFYERSLTSGGDVRKRGAGWIKKPHTIKITIQHAQEKGWTVSRGGKDKSNWSTVPEDMLFARAISRGQRQHCPDLTGGLVLYDPDELDNGGAVVDASFTVTEPARIPLQVETVAAPAPETPPVREAPKPQPAGASVHQVARIDELIAQTGRTRADMGATWNYFDVSGPELLTADQAARLIGQMEKKLQPAAAG